MTLPTPLKPNAGELGDDLVVAARQGQGWVFQPKDGNADTIPVPTQLPDGMGEPGHDAFREAVPGLAEKESQFAEELGAIVAEAVVPKHWVSVPANLSVGQDVSIPQYAKVAIVQSGAGGVTVQVGGLSWTLAANAVGAFPTLKAPSLRSTTGVGVVVFSSRYEDAQAIQGAIA